MHLNTSYFLLFLAISILFLQFNLFSQWQFRTAQRRAIKILRHHLKNGLHFATTYIALSKGPLLEGSVCTALHKTSQQVSRRKACRHKSTTCNSVHDNSHAFLDALLGITALAQHCSCAIHVGVTAWRSWMHCTVLHFDGQSPHPPTCTAYPFT